MKTDIFKPTIILRAGLGFMYAYSGIDLILHPTAWIWAIRPLPQALQTLIESSVGTNLFLQIQGGIELLFAAVLLLWFIPKPLVKLVALVSSIEMALILLFVGIDTITFRDIGVLAAGLGLFQMIPKK